MVILLIVVYKNPSACTPADVVSSNDVAVILLEISFLFGPHVTRWVGINLVNNYNIFILSYCTAKLCDGPLRGLEKTSIGWSCRHGLRTVSRTSLARFPNFILVSHCASKLILLKLTDFTKVRGKATLPATSGWRQFHACTAKARALCEFETMHLNLWSLFFSNYEVGQYWNVNSWSEVIAIAESHHGKRSAS